MSRRCGWCGRDTEDFIVHEVETDHGMDAVVWCTDAVGCNAARTRPPQVNRIVEHDQPGPARGWHRTD